MDTSVLAAFSGTGRIDLIFSVFPEIHIVPAVYREIVTDGQGWAAAVAAQSAIREGRFRIVEAMHCPVAPAFAHLGAGEREVLAWALHRQIPALIDEAPARKAAKQAGVVEVIGSLGILAKAKGLRRIDQVGPLVVGMRANGIHFGDDLVKRFLDAMNEK